MKTLHLLRHAKSSWDLPVSDRDRGLNQRGYRDAPRMAARIRQAIGPENLLDEKHFCLAVSPARRTQETLEQLELVWPELALLPRKLPEALYTFDSRDLLDWLRQLPDSVGVAFLIGHNPALTELLNTLVADPQQTIDNLPTTGFASLALGIERWRDLARECGCRTALLVPKDAQDPGQLV